MGDLGTLGLWPYPKVRDPAMVLELQIWVGVGWLRTLGAGAALGVNLRKLERPPLCLATLLAFASPSKTPVWQGG